MIELTINDIDYKAPGSWDEVTFEQFIEIQRIIEKYESINNRVVIKIISYLLNIDLDLLLNSDLKYINQISSAIQFLFSTDFPKEAITEFEFQEKKYKVIKDLKLSTLGEWVDMDYFLKNADNAIEVGNGIIAIYAKEEGEEKYDSGKVLARAELFKQLPVTIALPIINHIIQKKKEFRKLSASYSAAKESARRLEEIVIKRLWKNGVGKTPFILWLIMTYYGLILFLKKTLSKCLTFFPLWLITKKQKQKQIKI